MSDDTTNGKESKEITDDLVMRFRTVSSNVMGRIVRLGPAITAILNRHNYPPAVTEALGQAIALVAMLGTTLKGQGAILTLQAKSDGAISLLVADFESSGKLRGYASFREDTSDQSVSVFGNGSLAMTIDPGRGLERYQGIVALNGQSITDAAHTYFRQSEQLPTFVRLAVARHFIADANGGEGHWIWRAGGLMIQHLSRQGGVTANDDPSLEDQEPAFVGDHDDDWQRARHLAITVQDHELLDPTLTPERLLYRLFHEEGIVAFPPQAVRDECRCSRQRVEDLLHSLGGGELTDMIEDDGRISVTCEFCSTKYYFDPKQFADT